MAVAGGLFPCVSELADLYNDMAGEAPGLVVGSSCKLAGQIAAGAPFGLFISANLEWLHYLEKKGLVEEIALAAARALGDFGLTLMIAGNIPGRTQTLPLYIYSQIEALEFGKANVAAVSLLKPQAMGETGGRGE